ncbi:methyl-accepting chemotaxis protein [Clostridium estertheticum]|uniref:methyl-accepting chemotaxis protein n=1 Tax=Clostridium estertheticum TaxID=238834 RepID=UPI001C6E1F8D|nr:methyl-accepting chemotaxis protein [Clostridium estertheticum]MBW9172647.1 methyl-accepting chemotaxis protein [Clostridium estertheticum]WLC73610.1 methyl-accepting chemotaxis protein [Clostridium estertheticum]
MIKIKTIRGFKFKISIIIVIIIIIPLIISTAIIGVKNSSIMKKSAYTQQMDKANAVEKEIKLTLNDIQSLMTGLVATDEVQSMDFNKLDSICKTFRTQFPMILDFTALDPKGMMFYSSMGKNKLADRSNRDYYKMGMKGESGFSNVLISGTTKKPIIICFTPILKNGKIVGVLAANLSLDVFSDLVIKESYGKSGQVYLVDGAGKAIGHSNKKLADQLTDLTKLSPVAKVIKKQTGQIEYASNNVAKLSTYKFIDKINWGVIVEVNSSEAFNELNLIIMIMLVIIAGALLLSLIIANFLSIYITTPLKNITEKISLASEGHLDKSTLQGNILKRNDEFGQISNKFNYMIGSIGDLVREIKNSSGTLLDSSNSLTDITKQTALASEEVAKAIEDIAITATEQAKDTESSVSEISSITQDIEHVSVAASEMKDISNHTVEITTKGRSVVKLLSDKNNENNKANKDVSEVIQRVDESSQKIGVIIETIDNIAKQTNLLALNAAIEAARAGESGRGFAVVADEVRKLAEQSSGATNQIGTLITEVQTNAKFAVKVMKNTQIIVEEQNEAVYQTGEQFKDISESFKKLMDKMNEISKFSENMTNKKEAIVANITNISAAAEETCAATEEVSAVTAEQLLAINKAESHAEDLKQLVNKLENAVDKFKV